MPSFFSLAEVIDFHIEQIDLYGGNHGIRDNALLESALAVPASGLGDNYFHSFPFGMAAAYMFHIIQNHPFIDGNKRTGLATCLYFLGLHGIEVDVEPDELGRLVSSVAMGENQKPEIAKFLEEHSHQSS